MLCQKPRSLEAQASFTFAKVCMKKVIMAFVAIFEVEDMTEEVVNPSDEQLEAYEEVVENLTREISDVPCRSGRVGDSINDALESICDFLSTLPREHVMQYHMHVNYIAYIPALVLKLRTLKSTCNDRDFDCYAASCPIPFRLEQLTKFVMAQSDNKHLRKLILYKGLYPSIAEQVLYSSKNITHLTISYNNITNEMLDTLRSSCPLLRDLHFIHPFIWKSVSIEVLYRCFFNGYSSREIFASFEMNQRRFNSLSFQHLQNVTIAFRCTEDLIMFHQCLLFYYKNLISIWQEWYMAYFEADDYKYTSSVLHKMAKLEHVVRLRSLVLTISFLGKVGPSEFMGLLKILPSLKFIYIECSVHSSDIDDEDFWSNVHHCLSMLWEQTAIEHLYLKYPGTSTMYHILKRIQDKRSDAIISITVEENPFCMTPQMLKFISSKFPNLKEMKLISDSDRVIAHDYLPEYGDINLENLTQLYIHDKFARNLYHTTKLCHLITSVVTISPKIKLLSISVNDQMLTQLRHLKGPIDTLHLNFRSCVNQKDITKLVFPLIKRLPHLANLYLEEIVADSYWIISTYFQNSCLSVIWGSLSGLPRD